MTCYVHVASRQLNCYRVVIVASPRMLPLRSRSTWLPYEGSTIKRAYILGKPKPGCQGGGDRPVSSLRQRQGGFSSLTVLLLIVMVVLGIGLQVDYRGRGSLPNSVQGVGDHSKYSTHSCSSNFPSVCKIHIRTPDDKNEIGLFFVDPFGISNAHHDPRSAAAGSVGAQIEPTSGRIKRRIYGFERWRAIAELFRGAFEHAIYGWSIPGIFDGEIKDKHNVSGVFFRFVVGNADVRSSESNVRSQLQFGSLSRVSNQLLGSRPQSRGIERQCASNQRNSNGDPNGPPFGRRVIVSLFGFTGGFYICERGSVYFYHSRRALGNALIALGLTLVFGGRGLLLCCGVRATWGWWF